jgi:hypothetical protein
MKIKLVVESGIHILLLTDTVTVKDVEIIGAGLRKLLKNGKNRIILELDGSESLPDEVIRDIGFLDNMARELAGRIVLVSASEVLRKKLEIFSNPPLLLCTPSRKKGIEEFSQAAPLDEGKAAARPVPPQGAPQGAPPQGGPLQGPKEEALAREQGELGKVRRELAVEKGENRILHGQLFALMENRRQMVDSAALIEKIRALELEVEKLLVVPAKTL